jgi:hypothetical protein
MCALNGETKVLYIITVIKGKMVNIRKSLYLLRIACKRRFKFR